MEEYRIQRGTWRLQIKKKFIFIDFWIDFKMKENRMVRFIDDIPYPLRTLRTTTLLLKKGDKISYKLTKRRNLASLGNLCEEILGFRPELERR